ncbi:TorF family putative porin [Ferriphaselus sp. R-1]|uniref:TorF family putative porin n=1 Tax=Ferriphaselus sp. R-1 TaxID=1485544 RepID=UPI000557330C|nr:TorF family putative porin [Ferriphaselus sp. R-1]
MLNKKLLNTLVLAALAVPTLAMAEDAPAAADAAASPHTVTGNVGIVSDYVYRGIAQTSHNPAIQGGFDYAHASGLYAGVWGSNVSWIADSGAVAAGSVGMELDTYAGFKNTFAEDFSYDVGFVRYNYLGKYTPAAGFAKADTDEIYGAVGYKWISAKYSYGLGQFLTVPGAAGTNYLDLTATVPVADTGITVVAHVGKQTYKGATAAAFANSPTYTDYKFGVTKDFGGYVFGLAYTSTNATPFYTYPTTVGGNWGKGVVAASLTHAL